MDKRVDREIKIADNMAYIIFYSYKEPYKGETILLINLGDADINELINNK